MSTVDKMRGASGGVGRGRGGGLLHYALSSANTSARVEQTTASSSRPTSSLRSGLVPNLPTTSPSPSATPAEVKLEALKALPCLASPPTSQRVLSTAVEVTMAHPSPLPPRTQQPSGSVSGNAKHDTDELTPAACAEDRVIVFRAPSARDPGLCGVDSSSGTSDATATLLSMFERVSELELPILILFHSRRRAMRVVNAEPDQYKTRTW